MESTPALGTIWADFTYFILLLLWASEARRVCLAGLGYPVCTSQSCAVWRKHAPLHVGQVSIAMAASEEFPPLPVAMETWPACSGARFHRTAHERDRGRPIDSWDWWHSNPRNRCKRGNKVGQKYSLKTTEKVQNDKKKKTVSKNKGGRGGVLYCSRPSCILDWNSTWRIFVEEAQRLFFNF